MPAQDKFWWHLWLILLHVAPWIFLFPGLILIGKSAFEIVRLQHVTSNSLSWSSAGLLLLLIGSLMSSCRKEYKGNSPARVAHED